MYSLFFVHTRQRWRIIKREIFECTRLRRRRRRRRWAGECLHWGWPYYVMPESCQIPKHLRHKAGSYDYSSSGHATVQEWARSRSTRNNNHVPKGKRDWDVENSCITATPSAAKLPKRRANAYTLVEGMLPKGNIVLFCWGNDINVVALASRFVL